MNPRRVLVVEDDAGIRQGLADALRFARFEVFEAADGEAGLACALRAEIDLLLLDLMLPLLGGLDVLAEVRNARPTLPVIILTARGAEEDRVRGLRLGADDYVVKPFGISELLARIDAVLRRSPERPTDLSEFTLPGVLADFRRREVVHEDGERHQLSEKEAQLLRYLAVNGGRAVSRDEILAHVWGISARGIATRTIDMHIARLRDKLRDDPKQPRIVITVRGKGYMLGPPEPAP